MQVAIFVGWTSRICFQATGMERRHLLVWMEIFTSSDCSRVTAVTPHGRFCRRKSCDLFSRKSSDF
jgi:hypothetical protein